MKRRLISIALALFLLIPALAIPAYAVGTDPFILNLSETPESLYMGTGNTWPYNPDQGNPGDPGYEVNRVQLKFPSLADVGEVTYQWYRAEGAYPDKDDFPEHFEADTRAESSGPAKTVGTDGTTFTTPEFFRDISVAGIYTYCVVFTNTKDDGSTETFRSTQRVTYVAPQVLFATWQSNTYDTVYNFEGAPAPEITIDLGLPANSEEAAAANYGDGTIKYQWYKSSVAYSPFVYDEFPFFDETETPAIPGASGVITYADAADGATIRYTPVNDEEGLFYYWPLVYVETNGVMSYTPNIVDSVIHVLPSPVASVTRNPLGATVNLAVTLPEGSTVNPAYQYQLVPKGTEPNDSYTPGPSGLVDGAATLTLPDLTVIGEYDLYLKFTVNTKQLTYKASIPRYYSNLPSNGNAIDAGTTDGAVKGQGTMTTTNTETGATTTVTITGKSFGDMAAQAAANGVGMQINTPDARITFDETAALGLGDLADSRDVVLLVNRTDASILSEENQAIVGDRPVYDFTMTIGGTQVSSFEGGSATISIPYTLSPGEQPEAVVIYYIDDTGELVTVRGAYNAATGTVDFTVQHFSYYAVGYNPVSFVDVTADDWYYEAATFIAARGITTGVGGNRFAPGAVMTRGQFITMLMRAYEIAPDTVASDNFSDAGNTYYTNYLSAAKRLGIAEGIGGNRFAPDSSISRQDMFTLLYRALEVLGELPDAAGPADLSDYTDGGAVADYAKDTLTFLIASGIVKGSGGQLRPAATATRAEMAMVLYSLLSA